MFQGKELICPCTMHTLIRTLSTSAAQSYYNLLPRVCVLFTRALRIYHIELDRQENSVSSLTGERLPDTDT